MANGNNKSFFEKADDLFRDVKDTVREGATVLSNIGLLNDDDLKKVGDTVDRISGEIDSALETERRRQARRFIAELPSKLLSPTVLIPTFIVVTTVILLRRRKQIDQA